MHDGFLALFCSRTICVIYLQRESFPFYLLDLVAAATAALFYSHKLCSFVVRPHRALLCLFLKLNEFHIIFSLRSFFFTKKLWTEIIQKETYSGERAKSVAINKRTSVSEHTEREKWKQEETNITSILPIDSVLTPRVHRAHSTAQHSTECVRLKVKWNGKKCEKKIQLAHTFSECVYHNKYRIKTHIDFPASFAIGMPLAHATFHWTPSLYMHIHMRMCVSECEYKCLCLLFCVHSAAILCKCMVTLWLSTAFPLIYFRLI